MANIKNNNHNVICRAARKFKPSLLITGYWISSVNALTFLHTLLTQDANPGLLSDHQFTLKKNTLFHGIFSPKFKRNFDRSNSPWNINSKSFHPKVKC